MMKFSGFTDIDDAYAHYLRLLGDIPEGEQVRTRDELQAKIHAHGYRYEAIPRSFWDDLFEGPRAWAYGPYDNESEQA